MSLCINPRCLQPDHPGNDNNRFCQSCGSELLLQRQYRVMRLLSDTSGFGRVYEAYERNIPKILKVLKEVHNANAKAVELFQQEAAVLRQLRHPGVPKVDPEGYFQFLPRDWSESLHCLVMEKIDGPTLTQWMKQQGGHPLGEKQALDWLRQLAEILHLVHQQNYFHRDIKPQNIMIRPSGQLVLIDFGAAREMTYTYLAQMGGSGNVTRISSAGYTPPEQEMGQALPQSDFYALGRTFVYLLTGKQLTDSSIYDSMTQEIHWRSHAPHISPSLAELIDRLIAYRASDRPKNTQEILQTVKQLQQNLAEPEPTRHPSPETVVQASPRLQRPRIFLPWLLGGGLVVGLVVGGIAFSRFQLAPVPLAQVSLAPFKTLRGHASFVNAVEFSPDGSTLISAGADKTIRLWNIASGQVTRTLEGHTSFVNALAVSASPNGDILVSAGADRQLIIWNLERGESRHTLKGHTNFVNALTVSPDGQILASASADRTIKLWDVAMGKELRTLKGHTGFVNGIKFSPDGQILASASADRTVKLWDVATGKELRTLKGHTGFVNAVDISSDGLTLASGSADRTIKLWDMNTGKELRTLIGHTSYVEDLILNSNENILVSASSDKTFKFWDLTTGKVIQTLSGYPHPIKYFAISPGWQLLATGSSDRAITLWKLGRQP